MDDELERAMKIRVQVLCLVLAGLMCGLSGCAENLLADPLEEIRLGEEQAPKFAKQGGGAIPDAEIAAYVKKIGMDLVEQIKPEHRRGLPWVFTVLNSKKLNAFALPGGKVFVTRGLMEKMTNEAQLVAAVGHEVGHVVANHIGKQMAKRQNTAMWTAGIGMAGDYYDASWVGTVGEIGGGLLVLKYGRGQELEADSVGMVYMNRLGYDPEGMVQLLGILAEASKGGRSPEMFATHPDPGRRITDARELLAGPEFTTGRGGRLGEETFTPMLAKLKALPAPSESDEKKTDETEAKKLVD
jgi:predicted Zn-dependent protease